MPQESLEIYKFTTFETAYGGFSATSETACCAKDVQWYNTNSRSTVPSISPSGVLFAHFLSTQAL